MDSKSTLSASWSIWAFGGGGWNRTTNLKLMRLLCNHYTSPRYLDNLYPTPDVGTAPTNLRLTVGPVRLLGHLE